MGGASGGKLVEGVVGIVEFHAFLVASVWFSYESKVRFVVVNENGQFVECISATSEVDLY